MFSILRKKPQQYFTESQQQDIVAAIQSAEKNTSGEIRLFIESHCRFVDPIDRAKELFDGLEMEKTLLRNGVLVYIAIKDRQLAVYGDEGIHQKVGVSFWEKEIAYLLSHFKQENYVVSIIKVIIEIGEVLHSHFPYDPNTDKNELPDEIVFGK
ncbi:TPM domain-containing protein [Rhizosphaericola mali]|uniref:TPM domain-containing protein n=1 Tax=Rhizosphaericola mali TaxID=2545455 RepID=A0A5P2GAA8_9BACT|nr:TPM domain-containing protein [Rhizosphaericola mali]QES90640.1 TPM domain-containing protein [Rhizosphaericola mali]